MPFYDLKSARYIAYATLLYSACAGRILYAVADDNFSLGNSAPVEPLNGIEETIPGGDFPSSESESKSLFGDEPVEEPTFNNSSQKPGAAGSRIEPQVDAGSAKTLPKPQNTKPVVAAPAAAKVPPPPPAITAPATNLAQPSNTLKPPPASAIPAAAVAPSTVSAGPVLNAPAIQPQNFVAPLKTDGSLAPIKSLEPLPGGSFAGVPPLPGSRRNLARGQAPESYHVEAGDTLFDVCNQLIDDGNYWPRLWSNNPEIKNPHFIYPGMTLAFYPGDALNPPFVEVVEEDEMIPVDKGQLKETELVAQVAQVPKTFSNFSQPEEAVEVIGPEGVAIDESMGDYFMIAGKMYSGDDLKLTLPGFIFDTERDGIGLVDSGYNGEIVAGDEIRIRVIEAGALADGAVYTALRFTGEVVNPNTGETAGYRYDFSGNLRINSKRADGVYDAEVLNSRTGLKPGDIVVPFMSTRRQIIGINAIAPSTTADATIVAMGIASQTFGGEGTLVFLDRGSLSAGTFYSIYQKSHFSGMPGAALTNEDGASRRVGTLRIIESGSKTSVGIVMKNTSEIRLGDRLTAREAQ